MIFHIPRQATFNRLNRAAAWPPPIRAAGEEFVSLLKTWHPAVYATLVVTFGFQSAVGVKLSPTLETRSSDRPQFAYLP